MEEVRQPIDIFKAANTKLKKGLLSVLLFSFFINLFVLALPVYSLQVFDRVLTSKSLDTLWMLSLVALLFVVLHTSMDWVRSQLLIALSHQWNNQISSITYHSSISASSAKNESNASIVNMLKNVRTLFSSTSAPLFDLPWAPLLVLFLIALHPYYGLVIAISLAFLIIIAVLNFNVRKHIKSQSESISSSDISDTDSIKALGMSTTIAHVESNQDKQQFEALSKAQSKSNDLLAITKFVRSVAQIALVAVGASLVIDSQLTAGAMIAATMLASRVFAPFEAMVQHLYSWMMAKRYLAELNKILAISPAKNTQNTLPEPQGRISLSNVMMTFPGSKTPFLAKLNLEAEAGTCLAIVGESGSGKSTLLRAIAGLAKPNLGEVKLDNAALQQWGAELSGHHIGYYATNAEFFPGTVLENLSRFEPGFSLEEVHAACIAVGVHEMIMSWPKGYASRLGQDINPSSSEMHKLLIARAIYYSPKVLVLDQPDSLIGPSGDRLIKKFLIERKKAGLTTIFATNQSTLLNHSDRIVVLEKGTIKSDTSTKKIALAQSAALKKVSNHG